MLSNYKATLIVILTSVWLGLLTVLCIYFFFVAKPTQLQQVRRHIVPGSEEMQEGVEDHKRHPSIDQYERILTNADYKIIAKSLQSSHRRNSLDHVIFLSNLLPPITNVTRMTTPTSHTFLNYIAPVGLPVIFTDMLVGTKLKEWSWETIKKRWGDHIFHNTRQGNYSDKVNRFGKHRINRVSVRLSRFVDLVTGAVEPNEQEKGLYITKKKLLPPAALDEEFYYPPFYPGSHRRCFLEPTGWIGASGTFTQGHIDSKDNFVYQLIGQKEWTIYPPSDYHKLYYKRERGSLEWSRALSSKETPNTQKYPLYKDTHPIRFTMQPGEVLYLPRGWTHFVVNLSPSLMLNTWRRGPAAITELWIEKNRQEIKEFCFST